MLEPQPFSWNTARILIADDEPDMREIFSAWFRSLGCVVSEAADGKEALEALARERFDAIVTDVRMPRMDGVQLVRQLHESGRYTPVVIFVSGFVDLTLRDAFDLGVEAVLSKPCERKELVGAVRRCLLRRQLIFEPLEAIAPPAAHDYIRESFSLGASASQVALGRGGMSLNVRRQLSPGSTIGFALAFAEGPLTSLSGWGLLHWSDAIIGGSRVGMEFLHLEDESRIQFARWVSERNPVSFIPRHGRSNPSLAQLPVQFSQAH